MALKPRDKIELIELVSRMYDALDRHDARAVAALYADEGQLRHADEGRNLVGDEIRAFVQAGIDEGREDGMLHLASNPLFLDPDDTAPVLRVQSMKYQISTTPPSLIGPAWLTLTGRKVDGSWRIARLEVRW